MLKVLFKNKKLPFWLSVFGLSIFIGYWTYLDMNRSLINCPSEQSGTAAFLVLNTLDSSSRRINATFTVPGFNKDTDTIELSSVSSTSDPELNNYDPVFKVVPAPIPEASPSPAPLGNHPWTSINIPYSSKSFFYPFESYLMNIQIDYLRKGDVQTPIALAVDNRIDETIIVKQCELKYSFDKKTADKNSFHFVLMRHRFVRVTALILYIIAIFFLFYIARRDATKDVLTNSLGYIAALWGIRGIIVGSSKLFPTIIDFITLLLYVAVFIIVVYRLLFGRKLSHSK